MSKRPVITVKKSAIRNAVGLYKKFREADPEKVRAVKIDLPTAVMTMGRVSAIEYETTHDGTSQGYRHDFTPGSRPTLAASPRKNGLLLIGGRYHVTDRGIVDLDPAGREVEDGNGQVI
jgi:hypothetical protein